MKEIVTKRFDAMRQRFILDFYDDEADELEHHEFRELEEFMEALNGDLTGADLAKYYPISKEEKALMVSSGATVEQGNRVLQGPTTLEGAE